MARQDAAGLRVRQAAGAGATRRAGRSLHFVAPVPRQCRKSKASAATWVGVGEDGVSERDTAEVAYARLDRQCCKGPSCEEVCEM